MSRVLVSICCISYNHEAYIRQCLDGFVMQQTQFAFEVLIHDDASTDCTQEIIREYEAKYPDIIKPICQTENQYSKGVPISRTFNFPRAKGKYIAMCEGDDYWTDPLKLQKQVDVLESHPDVSFCFHHALVLHEYVNPPVMDTDFYACFPQGECAVEELVEQGKCATCSYLMRKECVEHLPENARFNSGDYLLLFASASLGKLYCIAEDMSVYRRNTGVTIRKKAEIRLDKTIENFVALKDSFPNLSARMFDNLILANGYIPYIFNTLRKSPRQAFQMMSKAAKQYHGNFWNKFIRFSMLKLLSFFSKEDYWILGCKRRVRIPRIK